MCQSFLLLSQSQTPDVVVGRSMEFPPLPTWRVLGQKHELDWQACQVPAGTEFSPCLAGQGGGGWRSTYPYIGISGFNQADAAFYAGLLGVEHPILHPLEPFVGTFSSEGINEAGLSASVLTYDADMTWSDGSGDAAHKVYWFLWVDYVLSQYGTVGALRDDLRAGQLLPFGAAGTRAGLNQPCHFIMHDKGGDWLVVEVNQGQPVLYDQAYLQARNLNVFAAALNGPLGGLLTNTPGLDWHYNNFRQYFHLSPYDPPRPAGPGSNMVQTSHGSGMVGLPGDFTAPSRFTRLANALRYAVPPADLPATIRLANHLLNSATIVEGLVVEATGTAPLRPYDRTDWVAIKHLSGDRPVLYYRPYAADPLSASMYFTLSFDSFPETVTYSRLGEDEMLA